MKIGITGVFHHFLHLYHRLTAAQKFLRLGNPLHRHIMPNGGMGMLRKQPGELVLIQIEMLRDFFHTDPSHDMFIHVRYDLIHPPLGSDYHKGLPAGLPFSL